MALTDLPQIKPPKGTIFIVAASLAVFVFFFTQTKVTDIQDP
ncbi:hypothetical protein [Lederbergia citrea]|nr:hypothetical protein [Lederbergia citrea]